MIKNNCACILFLLACTCALSQEKALPSPITIDSAYLPAIESLSPRIPIPEEKASIQNFALKDFNDDTSLFYRKAAAGEEVSLHFYRYRARQDDSLQSIAARLNIPQETLATANNLESPDVNLSGKELILPTGAGLFIPSEPWKALEILLEKEYAPKLSEKTPRYILQGRSFYFVQDARLTPTQRAFFLDTSMKMPLSEIVLTSNFGYRVSPISKTWKFHSGVDLAAPEGTDVYACKQGIVTTLLKNNPTFGNCIILQHANGLTSTYAHLSRITIKMGAQVSTGEKIGEVGSTGASTGPHLHFEVRHKGNPTNPLKNF